MFYDGFGNSFSVQAQGQVMRACRHLAGRKVFLVASRRSQVFGMSQDVGAAGSRHQPNFQVAGLFGGEVHLQRAGKRVGVLAAREIRKSEQCKNCSCKLRLLRHTYKSSNVEAGLCPEGQLPHGLLPTKMQWRQARTNVFYQGIFITGEDSRRFLTNHNTCPDELDGPHTPPQHLNTPTPPLTSSPPTPSTRSACRPPCASISGGRGRRGR